MIYTVKVYCSIPAHVNLTHDLLCHLKRQNLSPEDFTIQTFYSKEALYNYVRKFDYTDFYGVPCNHFLEATMCHINESRRHHQSIDSRHYRRSPINTVQIRNDSYFLGYLTHDSLGRVIDLRNYTKELYTFNNAAYEEQQRLARREYWELRNSERDKRWEKAHKLYEGKVYWAYYRRIRTTQERRYAADTEHKPYLRGSRSFHNLPNAYDDLYFRREKSWKARNKKVRRQWGVNLDSHIDTGVFIRYFGTLNYHGK